SSHTADRHHCQSSTHFRRASGFATSTQVPRYARDDEGRRQSAYAGNPAARIPKPIALFTGERTIVASTMAQQASTKTAVVSGWPGVRNSAGGRRLRKMNSASPVRQKKMKSVETT